MQGIGEEWETVPTACVDKSSHPYALLQAAICPNKCIELADKSQALHWSTNMATPERAINDYSTQNANDQSTDQVATLVQDILILLWLLC